MQNQTQSLSELLAAFTKSVNRDRKIEEEAATCSDCGGEGIDCPSCKEGLIVIPAKPKTK